MNFFTMNPNLKIYFFFQWGGGERGLEQVNFFKESKSKKKIIIIIFFFGGGGGGARVGEFFSMNPNL